MRNPASMILRTLAFIAAVTTVFYSVPAQAAPTDFTKRASSPVKLTCITVNPNTNIIYAQENEGTGFYSYNPVSNTWKTLASAPINSGNNGGAAYANGKIYTVYTKNDTQMGVYDIAGNSWTTLANPLAQGTGNITSIGDDLYLAVHRDFVRYNVISGVTTPLAAPPSMYTDGDVDGFEPWGGLEPYNGYIYGHQGNGYNGFARYDITNNTWTTLPSVPQENFDIDDENVALLGSAIDPVTGTYYTYGGYNDDNWYAYNIATNTWYTEEIPFFPADEEDDTSGPYGNGIDDGGMAYISTPGYAGIYFTEGEDGQGFGRYTLSSSVNGAGTLGNTNGKVKASFTAAYNKNGLGGSVTWTDSISKINFQATQIQSVSVNGNQATIFGVGTLNGTPGYNFTLQTADILPVFVGRGDYVAFQVGGYSFTGSFNPGDSKVSGGFPGGPILIP